MIKYLTFKSTNYLNRSIVIGEYEDGLYFVVAVKGLVPDDQNLFTAIEEIEQVLDDKLELLLPKKYNR